MKEIIELDFMNMTCLGYINEDNIYLNVSKWMMGPKSFQKWNSNIKSKQIIQMMELEFSGKELINKILDGPRKYRGVYVHSRLAIHIADWIGNDLSIKVSCLMDKLTKEVKDLKTEVKHTHLKIDLLLEDNRKIHEDNKKTHEELEKTNDKLEKTNTLLLRIAPDTVPTSGWAKIGIWLIGGCTSVISINNSPISTERVYRIIRREKKDYERYCNQYMTNEDKCIFNIETPNGIEFVAMFRKRYAKNINKNMNIVNMSRMTLTLRDNINENMLVETLTEHARRIEELFGISK